MIDFIAHGSKPDHHWRRCLQEGETVLLGRGTDVASEISPEEFWAVPWDGNISRKHARILWKEGRLLVRQLPNARNPIYFQGAERAEFYLEPGEHFVLGDTIFTLERQPQTVPLESPEVLQTRTVRADELKQLPFRDASRRLEVLSRLPGVISSAGSDAELYKNLVSLLLAGIPRATVVGLVAMSEIPTGDPHIALLASEHRSGESNHFQPSQNLIREAIRRQEETVLHIWSASQLPEGADRFTLQGNFDWAFCTPVRNPSCPGWGLYVTGCFGGEMATMLAPWENNDLSDDLKFTEMTAEFLGALRQIQALQHRQAVFGQFFSPEVLRVLSTEDPEKVFMPREADISVLFCDLRGFSRRVEREAFQILAILERVSRALEVMTRNILDRKGVIGDFQGDAAMGFWGWPVDQPDAAHRACRAALGIWSTFEAFAGSKAHPLSDFQVGIGIATGRAVAGKIGTQAQGKVTVFGPIVNLASRLEGMTKLLRVPILLDEATVTAIQKQTPPGAYRWRRLAKVLPYGLDTPLLVSELLPPADEAGTLSEEDVKLYEQALEAFLRGDWGTAYELLHRVPARDHGKDLLTGFILKHNHFPPPNWDGVIHLESK